MDGLARATGNLYRDLTVGGKRYRLATPRLGDLAALEAAILARLPDPVEQAAKSAHLVPPEQQQRYWEAAFQAAAKARAFKVDDLSQLPQSLQAAASAFAVLRRYHGEEIKDLGDALEWVNAALEEHGEEVVGKLQAVSQEDPSKNAETPSPPPGAS